MQQVIERTPAMFLHGLFARVRLPRWLRRKETSEEDVRSELQRLIEREFLYRGAPLVQVTTLTLSGNNTAVHVEFTARPLYQNDSRLKFKSWGQLFIEQVFEDTAKVLRTLWTRKPTLHSVSLKVLRRSLPAPEAADETILLLRATGAATRGIVLRGSKTSPSVLLQQCEVRYEPDPRLGLRALHEE